MSPHGALAVVAVGIICISFGHYNAMAEIASSDEVKRVVEDTIMLYSQMGGSFDMITPDEPNRSADGLYPFVINATSWTRVADGAVPDRVGKPETILDTTARSVEDILADLEIDGETWVTYIFHHPPTGTDQVKHTYLRLYNGLVFGSGYYLLDDQVRELVYGQIQEFVRFGSDAFAANSTTLTETASDYVFVVNPDTGVVMTQNTYPDLVMSEWDTITQTVQAEDILDELSTGAGMWVGYTFTNPVTGDEESKRTYLVLHDGLVFGSGYYSLDIPVSSVKFAVNNAIDTYESNMENDMWVSIITPDAPIMLEDYYPFVLNATTWQTVAHGAVPARVGYPPDPILDTADRPMEHIQADLEADGATWVSYFFTNPPTGITQLKYSYMKLHDGLIFGAGHYILDSQAQAAVQNIVLEYSNKGKDVAFADLISVSTDTSDFVFDIDHETGYARNSLFVSGVLPSYTFVVDPGTGTIVAYNIDPDVVNVQDWNDIISTVPMEDLLGALNIESGTWVTYASIDFDGQVLDKRAWLTLHDGLVFGSGYVLPS